MTARPFWWWCLFPALTMSLGWGLRGSIGGGPLGAMIPGAMIGLVLCLLLGRRSDAALIAALGAIGVGFGGQETYGQTVGLSLQPETFWWAILGFAIKGAVWGLLGGAFIGIALDRIPRKRAIIGFALMVAGTWVGWQLINVPKLIYFSNRLDRPREELWAGLWLGGLLMLVWLRARVPTWFALYGLIGGGIGFAFGASLQPWGRDVWAAMPLGWWKAMELTFGALLGAAYGVCAWRFREALEDSPKAETPAPRSYVAVAFAAVAIVLVILAGEVFPLRFNYTLAGAVLGSLVLYSSALAWQTAITATYAAFTWDLIEHQQLLPAPAAWAWAAATTAAVSLIAARYSRPHTLFLLLTWTATGTAFRYLLPPNTPRPEPVTMLIVFVLFAVSITLFSVRLAATGDGHPQPHRLH
jgi:hypothetical protein